MREDRLKNFIELLRTSSRVPLGNPCNETTYILLGRHRGAGLIQLFVKQVVARFLFFQNAYHHYHRTYLPIELSKTLTYLADSSVPVCALRPFGFLREVVSAIEVLKTRVSLEYLFKVRRKTIYADLSCVVFPVLFISKHI